MAATFATRFRTDFKIGGGGFGDVFVGHDRLTGEEVAIKYEDANATTTHLANEMHVYTMLAGGVGIPRMLFYGTKMNKTALVTTLHGASLEEFFDLCGRSFSLKTVLMLGYQLLSRLEYIHDKGFVHRDLKPSNLVMGMYDDEHLVHVIDYGLSTEYRDPNTGKHYECEFCCGFKGTALFASHGTHVGDSASRKDDLESLGYILLYFCRGSLP